MAHTPNDPIIKRVEWKRREQECKDDEMIDPNFVNLGCKYAFDALMYECYDGEQELPEGEEIIRLRSGHCDLASSVAASINGTKSL